MTCRELYRQARAVLAEAGVEDWENDARLLTEHFLGLSRARLALRGGETPSPAEEAAFLRAVQERAERRPLQYILGHWEFMGLDLAVGEGVLCPREDTAVLAEALARGLKETPAPRGVDLCAGSGAVALGLCTLISDVRAVCIELSADAFPFLEKNLAAHSRFSLQALRGDILLPETAAAFEAGSLDFIAANPPYIPTGELAALQAEVGREPRLALDGGADGLRFYRAIAELWTPLLKPGGLLAVEIGKEQGEAVSRLFSGCGMERPEILKDWAGLDRVVTAGKPRK